MDTLEALEAAEIEVHQSDSNPEEITICCPFCIEEGEPTLDERFRLGINIRTGKAQCFNCGKSSHGGEWIFKELVRVLDTGEIEAAQEVRKKKKSTEIPELPTGFIEFGGVKERDKDHWYRKAYRYAKHRGISDRQLGEKNIGYTTVGRYSHRLIFPIIIRGKLRGFSSRAFVDGVVPTHKNSIGDKALYNYPKSQHNTAVLSESAITALAIDHVSRKLHIDSLGILGHTLTSGQLELLKPYKRIIHWLDPDEAGLNGSIKIRKQIQEKFKDKIQKIVLPRSTDADPDELEKQEIEKRLLKAENYTNAVRDKLKVRIAFDE